MLNAKRETDAFGLDASRFAIGIEFRLEPVLFFQHLAFSIQHFR